jgi:hypothetical protein
MKLRRFILSSDLARGDLLLTDGFRRYRSKASVNDTVRGCGVMLLIALP